jgi:hypothetical protein
LLLIGQLGDADFVDDLEPLLEDRTVLISRQAAGNRPPNLVDLDLELRDVALNMLLLLTKQSPAGYGYPQLTRANVQDVASISMMVPRSAAEREAAIAKWRRWKAGPGSSVRRGNSPAADNRSSRQ